MSTTTVKNKIVEKLNDMQTLKAVYAFETQNPDGQYPLATVTVAGGAAEFRAWRTNQRNRSFTVNIFQERMSTGQGSEQAETIIQDVLDEIEPAFDMDTTLSGTCKYAIPIEWVPDYDDREHDVRVLTITIEAVELVSAQ
jgi:hypothetical protein